MTTVAVETAGDSSQEPYGPRARLQLIAEVLITYARVRLLMRRHPLPEVLRQLRASRGDRLQGIVVEAPEFRLAFVIQRVMRLLPADTRCLMKSLVLVTMLSRRRVEATLVIGAAAGDDFEAHAWVERDGQALLWSGGAHFGRLTEL